MTDLWQAFSRWRESHILVLGDVMLDRYCWGEVERISPEAPVPILHADLEEIRPGGAAAVAALLAGLQAKVQLAGVIDKEVVLSYGGTIRVTPLVQDTSTTRLSLVLHPPLFTLSLKEHYHAS